MKHVVELLSETSGKLVLDPTAYFNSGEHHLRIDEENELAEVCIIKGDTTIYIYIKDKTTNFEGKIQYILRDMKLMGPKGTIIDTIGNQELKEILMSLVYLDALEAI